MSYGKDPILLEGMGGFGSTGQQMSNATRRVKRESRGAPSWADNYQPSDQTVDEGRLLAGQYEVQRADEHGNLYTEILPWFECRKHFHGTLKRSSICSAGPNFLDRKNRQPCHGCDIFWEDYEVRKAKEKELGIKPQNPKRVSAQDQYVFLFLDLGFFYQAPQVDEHGMTRMNPNTGKPYFDWKKYRGPHQNAEAQAAPASKWGHVQSWPMGKDYFNIISGYGDVIGSNCLSCGGQGSIQVWKWNCGKCGTDILDRNTSTIPPEHQKELMSRPTTCRGCGQTAYPNEVLWCGHCGDKGRRASIFDVNWQFRRQPSTDGKGSQLMVIGNPVVCAIDPKYQETLKKLPDLVKKFGPTPLAEQAALFNHGGPQHAPQQPVGPAMQPYQQNVAPQYAQYAPGTQPAHGVPQPQLQQAQYAQPGPQGGYPPGYGYQGNGDGYNRGPGGGYQGNG